MRKLLRFWKIIILDTLGVLFMIGAILTGWLPGPGGIPLFIVGLGLLAINHEWAQKYIDLLKKHADKLGELIFVNNPLIQWLYDIGGLAGFAAAIYLMRQAGAMWQLSLGVFLFFMSVTFLLGNRQRWMKLKSKFKLKR